MGRYREQGGLPHFYTSIGVIVSAHPHYEALDMEDASYNSGLSMTKDLITDAYSQCQLINPHLQILRAAQISVADRISRT